MLTEGLEIFATGATTGLVTVVTLGATFTVGAGVGVVAVTTAAESVGVEGVTVRVDLTTVVVVVGSTVVVGCSWVTPAASRTVGLAETGEMDVHSNAPLMGSASEPTNTTRRNWRPVNGAVATRRTVTMNVLKLLNGECPCCVFILCSLDIQNQGPLYVISTTTQLSFSSPVRRNRRVIGAKCGK
jgi:hypothetical protein